MHRWWIRLSPAWCRETVPRHHAASPRFEDADGELPVEPEKPWGCGWFDSSLDLRQGLAVTEHASVSLELAVQMLVAPEAVGV